MLQPFDVTVVPQLWSVLESAATPTIVSIGPMQILAVNTPQYPMAIMDDAPWVPVINGEYDIAHSEKLHGQPTLTHPEHLFTYETMWKSQ